MTYLTRKYDGETIRAIFQRSMEVCDSFPSLKQFDEVASQLGKQLEFVSRVPSNAVHCDICNDNGFIIKTNPKTKTDTAYGCAACPLGQHFLGTRQLPNKTTVENQGYTA